MDGALALPGGRLAVEDISADGPVVAMIRPEAITVAAPGEASLSGSVESVSFVGDRQRLTVSGAAARTVTVDTANTVEIKIGERIGLVIDPRSIRVIPGAPS